MFLKLNLQFFAEGEVAEQLENWDHVVDAHEAETETNDEQPVEDSEEEVEAEGDDDLEASEDEVEPDTSEEETEEDPDEEDDSEEAQEESEDTEDESAQSELSDDTEIDLGEEKVQLKDLKDGYLRQSDYTKKTQEVAEERKQLEQQQEDLKPVQEWREWMDTNPFLNEQITNLIEQYKNSGVAPIEEVLQDAQYSKYVNHLMAENKKLKSENENLNNTVSTTKFDSEFNTLENDLKNEYGDLVDAEYTKTLRQKADEKGFSIEDLREIADGQLAKKKLEQEQEKSKKAVAQSKKRQKEKKLPPQPKPKGQKPSEAAKTAEGWGDLLGLDE